MQLPIPERAAHNSSNSKTPKQIRVMIAPGCVILAIFAILYLLTAGKTSFAKEITLSSLELRKVLLSNGLKVILVPEHRVAICAIAITYKVGSASESPGHTGFAHLFEHLMFQGSEN